MTDHSLDYVPLPVPRAVVAQRAAPPPLDADGLHRRLERPGVAALARRYDDGEGEAPLVAHSASLVVRPPRLRPSA